MFDKEAWVREYIGSKAVRDHMACVGFCFSDAEMATITFQSGKPLQTLHRTLEELAGATEDQALKEQIQERLAYERRCMELFETNDGSCFYQVSSDADTEKHNRGDTMGHFASAELAIKYMADKKLPFSIKKYQIIGLREQVITPKGHWNPRIFPEKPVEEDPYGGHAIGACSYDAEGNLLRCWTEEISNQEQDKVEDWGAARFEHRYISMPNPFERGDLVRCVGDGRDSIGIVETSQADWSEWEKRARERNLALDFYDASLTVEFPTEQGTFYHSHISPIYLEKVELEELEGDERKDLLEAASGILTGHAALDWFTSVCESCRKKTRKKDHEEKGDGS